MRGQLHKQAGVMRRLAVFRVPFLLSLLFDTCAFLSNTSAEVRVVYAQGQHRMGDRDTREDAVRLATESAKRNALEQVATYLESITVTDGMDLVRDEVHTYSAGLVLVLDQQIETLLDGDTVIVNVDLVTQIDTEDLSRAIAALRESEDARVQLSRLRQDNEQLQKDLAAANQALANASTPDQAQQAALQRQEILNRVQSNAMVSQVWTDWVLMSPVAYSSPWIVLGVGLAQTRALLNSAGTLYPGSPHVTVAEQIVATRQPPSPPHPPAPPAPGSWHGMPRHETVAPPGSPGKPRTLNEITHTSPTRPPPISHQPGSRLTAIHEMNPSLPPDESQIQVRQHHGGMPPASAARPAPSGAHENSGGQPSITHRLPPTPPRVHPPATEVPRVPHQVAPRTSGGGQGGGRREDHGGGRKGKP